MTTRYNLLHKDYILYFIVVISFMWFLKVGNLTLLCTSAIHSKIITASCGFLGS